MNTLCPCLLRRKFEMNNKAISRTSAALALIVIVVIAGLIGAVYNYSSKPSALTATTTMAQGPVPDFVKTSTYVYESGYSFQYLDPAISYFNFDSEIEAQVYENLLRFNGNSSSEVIPWLAESYQKVSPTQYQFKLRQGITFQDGTPFNAKAVWFSYNRVLMIDGTSGTGSHGTQSAWIIQQMLDPTLFSYYTPNQPYDPTWVQKVLALNFIETVDPYTINVNIKNPTTQFDYLLGSEFTPGIVSPSFVVSHDFPAACKTSACGSDDIDYTAYFNHIAGHGDVSMNYLNMPQNGAKAGTGPYYIDSVNPTTYEIIMKANPNYWGGAKEWSGPPMTLSMKTIDYLYQPDLATRILDLRGGKASGIYMTPADIYSIADRDQWMNNGKLVSIVPGVTIYGPFPTLHNFYFPFITNVTEPTGNIRKFQPFADIRFRLAVADAINLTDANIYINNKLGVVKNELALPALGPPGSWNPDVKPIYSYDLTKAEQLLVDAQKNPLTHFVDMNGHPYQSGVIDNSFGPTKPQVIVFYNPTGDTVNEKILTTLISNLNDISTRDNLGLTFTVADVPGGQQFTLASEHSIYLYTADWYADYNHIMDYLTAIFFAGGNMPQWDNFNVTALNTLFHQAVEADRNGDVQSLLRIHNEMEIIANQQVMYIYTFDVLQFSVTTSYLRGYFFNVNTLPYYACYSYAAS